MQPPDYAVTWHCFIALAAAVAACSGNPQTLGELPQAQPGAAGMSSATGGSGPNVAAGGSGPNLNLGGGVGSGSAIPACAKEARDFIYLMDFSGKLSKFSPTKKAITPLGTVSCSKALSLPNLAIDQNGAALVHYQLILDGGDPAAPSAAFNIDTENARCGAPLVDLPMFNAMAFVSDGTTETLYGRTGDGNLSSVNLSTKSTTVVPFSGVSPGDAHSLTGTGDGRLFDLVRGKQQEILQITASTGEVISRFELSTRLGEVHEPIAFWGGRLYIFYQGFSATDPTANVPTTIAEYDPVTKSLNPTFMTGIADEITASAVSACAPLVSEPPK